MSTELIKEYGDQALAEMKIQMGDKWSLLTDAQLASAKRAGKRIITLELKKRAGEDVQEDIDFVVTTLEELKLMMEIALGDLFWSAFWDGVNKSLDLLGTFLVKTAGKALGAGFGVFNV